MSCKHLIDLNDFAVEDWKSIVSLAVKIRQSPADYQESCRELLSSWYWLLPVLSVYRPVSREPVVSQSCRRKIYPDAGLDLPVSLYKYRIDQFH